MQSIPLQTLSDPVRSFLAEVASRGGVIVKDDAGRPCYSVNTLRAPSAEEQTRSFAQLDRIQEQVGRSMAAQGVSEDDVDRLLQEEE